jgi:hypothetical protein
VEASRKRAPFSLARPEGVQRADGADLHRLDGQQQVVDRAGGLAKCSTWSTGPGTWTYSGHVALEEPEAVGLQQVLDVVRVAGDEVVEGDHLVALGEQPLAQVRAEEAGSAGDDRPCHGSRT